MKNWAISKQCESVFDVMNMRLLDRALYHDSHLDYAYLAKMKTHFKIINEDSAIFRIDVAKQLIEFHRIEYVTNIVKPFAI